MSEQEAEQLISSLELLAKTLDYPMYLGSTSADKTIKRMIGDFSSKLITEIHFELIPRIKEHYNNISDDRQK